MRFGVAASFMLDCGGGIVSLGGSIIGSSKGNKKRHAPNENRAADMVVEVHSKI